MRAQGILGSEVDSDMKMITSEEKPQRSNEIRGKG